MHCRRLVFRRRDSHMLVERLAHILCELIIEEQRPRVGAAFEEHEGNVAWWAPLTGPPGSTFRTEGVAILRAISLPGPAKVGVDNKAAQELFG